MPRTKYRRKPTTGTLSYGANAGWSKFGPSAGVHVKYTKRYKYIRVDRTKSKKRRRRRRR